MQKFRKNLKNKKKSHRMRGGGGCHSRAIISHPPPKPKIYGIVIGPDGHYVESFNLLESGNLNFYTSDQQPPKQMTLQVTDNPVKMGQVAASAIPRPVAIIQYDVSQRDEHNNPSALSENLYLYSSRDDAEIALIDLLLPAAVHATGHLSETVSNKAKALLQPQNFTPSEKTTAHALGGLRQKLVSSFLLPGQLSSKSYAKMANSITRAPPTTPGGSRSRRRRRR